MWLYLVQVIFKNIQTFCFKYCYTQEKDQCMEDREKNSSLDHSNLSESEFEWLLCTIVSHIFLVVIKVYVKFFLFFLEPCEVFIRPLC